MYIKVHAIADAKKERVVQATNDRYDISVKEPAERNLANSRIRVLLAAELKVPVSALRLISGHHSLHKIFSVQEVSL